MKKPAGYWTYLTCYEEALKYKSRGEFGNGNETAYKKSLKNKWIDNFYWLEDKRFDLINDKIDCVYAYEFQEQKSVYIGRTLMRLKKRRDLDHVFSEKDTVYIYAKENDLLIPEPKYIEENLTIKQGRDRECFWIDEYKRLGWNVLNKTKGGSIGRIGHRFSKYTYEICYELAKNCHSKKEFEKYNASAYNIAYKNKWLEDYIWFISYSKPRGYWNYKHCYEEAKKYSTLTEFKKNNHAAYEQARKNNWIQDYIWIKRRYAPKGFWCNYENCYNEAKKYTKYSNFVKMSGSAYSSAKRHGWIKDYIWLERTRKNKTPAH